jgi:outer membrane biosynthesis protein TonB
MLPGPRPPLTLRVPRARRRPWALTVSLLVHGIAVALLATSVRRDWARTPAPGPIAIVLPVLGGGGGGNREAYISPPAAPAAPRVRERPAVTRPRVEPLLQVPTPVAQPEPEPVPVAPLDTQPAVAAAAPDSADAVSESGGGAGPGTGPGAGGGAGGGTGGGTGPGVGLGAGGRGGRGRPPEPRQLVIPPSDFPKELRGRRIEVTFFVAADGRVEHIEVVPAIANGGFARKFDETMRNYRFRPARSAAGSPVAGSTTITVSF